MAAVVLAAGLGRRLGGRPKSLLEIDGVSVLAQLIQALRDGGAGTVSVVVGPYREQLSPILARCGAQEWAHDQPHPGLIESQRLALKKHVERQPHHDLMLTVADLPLITATEIRLLLEAWRHREPAVDAMWPVVKGVPGHPRILSSAAARGFHALPKSLGVQQGVRQLADQRALAWPSDNRAYTTDFDTPEDIQALRTKLSPRGVLWPWF